MFEILTELNLEVVFADYFICVEGRICQTVLYHRFFTLIVN